MKLAEVCVVLCAGRGERMLPPLAKVAIEIGGRPMFSHVIDYWKHRVDRFVFVVGYKKRDVINAAKRQGVAGGCTYVEQTNPRGIAHAVSLVRRYVGQNFVVALGDCLQAGYFVDWPDYMDCGVGVWRRGVKQGSPTEGDIRQGYAVDIMDEMVVQVREKPEVVGNGMCGMGTYYFNRRVFDHISKTPPSSLRGEIEITDVVQRMIDADAGVKPLWFHGDYINVTYVTDLERAEKMLQAGAVSA